MVDNWEFLLYIVVMGNTLTPMMQQYKNLKEHYVDNLLFFRLGDFYELFFEDAEIASRELGITLTGRDCGMSKRAPMCGVPHHAATTYIKRLVDRGYSVAICEQISAPVKGKGMFERDVVKVISPGTITDETFLDQTKNNFVAAVFLSSKGKGSVAWCDISTGHFFTTQAEDIGEILDTLAMINPREIISTVEFAKWQRENRTQAEYARANDHYSYAFTTDTAHGNILSYFNIKSAEIFDIPQKSPMINSTGALLEYLQFTQKRTLPNIQKVTVIQPSESMVLDKTARDHLEITHQYRDPSNKYGTLLWVLDDTKTPMGARLLSSMSAQPLRDINRINARLDAVMTLCNGSTHRTDLRMALGKINDIARLCSNIATRAITPRQMQALSTSLEKVIEVKRLLSPFEKGLLRTTRDNIAELPELIELIKTAIVPEPPSKLDDGGYIADGYNTELDELRDAARQGHVWLGRLEQREREETGIRELKIGYNRVVGYYFEIPKKRSNDIPFRFERRGGTISAERFTTPELQELESKTLNVNENVLFVESKLLSDLRDNLLSFISPILTNAEQIAIIDVLCNLASVARANSWVRPTLNDDGILELTNARHPVVEKLLGYTNFIANDCKLQRDKMSIMIITGPNMAGKSTYMRGVALNVLLAHIGSFVPCTTANISITDRIFTRIGASDSMLTGQSTFMVETNEISRVLNSATEKSLVLLDEVGRGTGAQEGRALASALITHITDKIGCMTMFATHFHELTELSTENAKIKNYRAMTSFVDDNVVFLHKIEPGIEMHSFGLEVAKLSGIPKVIIDEARRLFEIDKATQAKLAGKDVGQIVIEKEVYTPHPVISKLQEIDVNHMSPMEALSILGELAKESNS